MQKVDVKGLSGTALDWAVAVCEGLPIQFDPMGFGDSSEGGYWVWFEKLGAGKSQKIGRAYSPSTCWALAGPIIEQQEVYPSRYHGCGQGNPEAFQAGTGLARCRGRTPLIAAMRAYVASEMGEEIELPNGLIADSPDQEG